MSVYALNLFDIADKEEYLAYARRSVQEVNRNNGHVISLGKFREAATDAITPRMVMIVVEWDSIEDFHNYCNDPALADLHPHREKGTKNYIWQLFDKLDDLRPILKDLD